MKFLTFNVLYAHRGPHPWSRRKAAVLKRLLEESADIIGLQEVLPLQRGELELGLGERYQAVGIGRDADGKGEQCPIFFRKDRFAQLDWTTLWLSVRHPVSVGQAKIFSSSCALVLKKGATKGPFAAVAENSRRCLTSFSKPSTLRIR